MKERRQLLFGRYPDPYTRSENYLSPFQRRRTVPPSAGLTQKSPTPKYGVGLFFGGPGGIRTLDLCDANAALSQLSYGPIYLTTLNILTLSNGFVKVFLSVPCCAVWQTNFRSVFAGKPLPLSY